MLTTDISKRLGIIDKPINNKLHKYNFDYKKNSIRVENDILKNTINDLVKYKRNTHGESFVSKTKEFASKIWKTLLKLARTVREFITSVINKFKDKDRLIGKLARTLMETSRKIEVTDNKTEVILSGDWFKYMIQRSNEMQLKGMDLDDIPRPIMELFQSIMENDGKIQVYAIDEAGRLPDGTPYYKRDRKLKSATETLIQECEESIEKINKRVLKKSLFSYDVVSRMYNTYKDMSETISLKEFKERLYQNSKDLQKIYGTIIYTDFSIKNLNEMLFYIEKWAKRRMENKDIVGNDEYDQRITEFASKCQNFTSKQLKRVSAVTDVTNKLTNQCVNYTNTLLRIAKPYIKKKGKGNETDEKSK